MSAPTKLRPGQSQLTALKTLWRTMSEEARDYWRERFVSSELSQAEIRRELFAKLKINLKYDSKLNAFRDWELEQRKLDIEAERQSEDERRFTEEFGADNLELVREKVLKKSYARAIAAGDFSEARKTIVQDVNLEKVSLDKRRVALLEQKAAAYDRAQAALTEAKASKGGITKETLKKIEAELNLL